MDDESPIMIRYNRLRGHVGVDLTDLDEMYMTATQWMQDAAELTVMADEVEAIARHNYDIVVAEAAARLRMVMVHGKEPSQARIDSMIPMDADVKLAWAELRQASTEADYCSRLWQTFRERPRLITKATDGIRDGLLSPTALLRAEQRDARMNLQRQRRGGEEHGDRLHRPHN